MFNDTNSFYLSPTGDLTNTLQRQYEQDSQLPKSPLWRRVDDRFFWNREMLRDLTEREVSGLRGNSEAVVKHVQNLRLKAEGQHKTRRGSDLCYVTLHVVHSVSSLKYVPSALQLETFL